MADSVHPLWDLASPVTDISTHPLWEQGKPADKSVIITPKEHGFGSGFGSVSLLNPDTWGPALESVKKGLWNPLSPEEKQQKANEIVDHATKIKEHLDSGDLSGALRTATGLSSDNSEAAGQVAGGVSNAALLALLTAGIVHGTGLASDAIQGLKAADPIKDINTVYSGLDSRIKERGPVAMGDIKRNAPSPITTNEHLASDSPDYLVHHALRENRDVMSQWHDPIQQAGFTARPDSILAASDSSLKSMATPEKRAAIRSDVRDQVLQEPLTPNRLKVLIEEKNGELKSFYDKDPSVRAAAEQAGAVSGRSQALLEAQAKALRDEYYNLLDPKNNGAGPREIQQRYGNIKALTSEANGARNSIDAENAGTRLGKLQDVFTSLLELPGKGATGDLKGSLSNIRDIFTGKSNPLIERAFKNAPESSPLPQAPSLEERYPTTARADRMLHSAPITTEPPADTSEMRVGEGLHPTTEPNPALRLPPATSKIGVSGTTVPADIAGKNTEGSIPLLKSAEGQAGGEVPPRSAPNKVPGVDTAGSVSPEPREFIAGQGRDKGKFTGKTNTEVIPKGVEIPTLQKMIYPNSGFNPEQLDLLKKLTANGRTLKLQDLMRIKNLE